MSTDRNWTVLSYTEHKSDRNHWCRAKAAILDSQVRIGEVCLTLVVNMNCSIKVPLRTEP